MSQPLIPATSNPIWILPLLNEQILSGANSTADVASSTSAADAPASEILLKYLFICTACFACTFLVGMSGVGGIAMPPVMLLCFPHLNPAGLYATWFVPLVPMSLTSIRKLRSLMPPLRWICVVCPVAFATSMTVQFVLGSLPKYVVGAVISGLCFFGGFVAFVEGRPARRGRGRRAPKITAAVGVSPEEEMKVEKAGDREERNPKQTISGNSRGRDMMEVDGQHGDGPPTSPSCEDTSSRPMTNKVTEDADAVPENNLARRNNRRDFRELRSFLFDDSVAAPDEKNVPFPEPLLRDHVLFAALGIILGIAGGPVVMVPVLFWYLPRSAARRLNDALRTISVDGAATPSSGADETGRTIPQFSRALSIFDMDNARSLSALQQLAFVQTKILVDEDETPCLTVAERLQLCGLHPSESSMLLYFLHEMHADIVNTEDPDDVPALVRRFCYEKMWPPLRIIACVHPVALTNLSGGIIGALLFTKLFLLFGLLLSVFTVSGVSLGIRCAKKISGQKLKQIVGVLLMLVGLVGIARAGMEA